jgi:hypothetical protein
MKIEVNILALPHGIGNIKGLMTEKMKNIPSFYSEINKKKWLSYTKIFVEDYSYTDYTCSSRT